MTDYAGLTTTGPGSGNPDSAVSLGMEFYVTSAAYVKAIRFWRATTSTVGTITGGVFQVATATTGSLVTGTNGTFTLSGTGWQTYTLPSLIPLTINQRYEVAVNFGSGGYAATGSYFTSTITNGPLVIPTPANTSAGGQGRFDYSASLSYPATPTSGSNYWVDVVVTDSASSGSPAAAAGFIPLCMV